MELGAWGLELGAWSFDYAYFDSAAADQHIAGTKLGASTVPGTWGRDIH